MDNQLEFTSMAFCKMIMHTMKHSHSVCCGLFLSPKQSSEDGSDQEVDNEGGDQENTTANTKVIDVIPLLHTSHYLAPAMEVALNSVSVYALEQELSISGYYYTNVSEVPCYDIFGQRVTEKIAETYPNAALCLIGYEPHSRGQLGFAIVQHHYVDGKWHRKPSQTYKVEDDIDIVKERIIFSKEKLYRQIVDFDDHFNNISLDWTNAKISQRIDYLVANIC